VNNENEGLPSHPLSGRTALVTGGGRGIGASIATLLVRAGARVALAGRSEKSLREVAAALPGAPRSSPLTCRSLMRPRRFSTPRSGISAVWTSSSTALAPRTTRQVTS
jgi:NAD(P)-dependent dehydrogenase (short-subunit alcohol dehydrogenase family)